MTKTSKTIVFFGTEDFSLQSLQALITSGYKIALVVTKPDSKKGRGQKVVEPAVKSLALQHGITVLQPSKLSEITNDLKSLNNPLGVLVSYGKIIPQTILDVFPDDIINIHPSLLPKYRGPSPIESAILNGDAKTGISIMKISQNMDAGPVYKQLEVALNGTENRVKLYDKLAKLGATLLTESLGSILSGDLRPIDQDENKATYCNLLSKQDSALQPDQRTAIELERQIRAYLGYPKSRYKLCDQDVIVTKASVSVTKLNQTDIHCQDGSYLVVEKLIAPSGREMNIPDFINGYC